jgi:hypothetical protein
MPQFDSVRRVFLSARTAALLMVATIGVTDGRAQSPAPEFARPAEAGLADHGDGPTNLRRLKGAGQRDSGHRRATGPRPDDCQRRGAVAANTATGSVRLQDQQRALRGIDQPVEPASTFIDGVPQLSTNTANIELLDAAVEFVRGAQSALFDATRSVVP